MKYPIYNKAGKETGAIDLPSEIFECVWKPNLVKQVATAMDANARNTLAHTKDRSEVRGGGKKPWRQKGTGRARHGSSRSPIWSGGGITFGPTNLRDFSQKINKKMKIGALRSLLSKKAELGNMLLVQGFVFDSPSTKSAKEIINNLSLIKGFSELQKKKKNAALIVFGRKDRILDKSFRNISNIRIMEARNMNVRDILRHKHLVFIDADEVIGSLATDRGVSEEKTDDNK